MVAGISWNKEKKEPKKRNFAYIGWEGKRFWMCGKIFPQLFFHPDSIALMAFNTSLCGLPARKSTGENFPP